MKKCKQYRVISPDGKIISVEEYMETDDYNDKLEQQINDFMTNKKEGELIELFEKRRNGKM
jgi:Tol biopolymer transport system component